MAALVLYTYCRASKLDSKSDAWIFYGSFRFFMQMLVYMFLTTKELTNTRTYVVGMITLTTWIVFLGIGVVDAILRPRPTHE